MTNHRSRLPASGRLRWRAALALAALGGAALSAAGAAGPAAASAHARSFPLLPGDLLVSRSVYTGTPGLLQPGVTVLPPGCTTDRLRHGEQRRQLPAGVEQRPR